VSSHGIRRGVRRGFSIGEDLRHRLPTLEARANRYLPVLDVTLRVVLYVVALAILLNIWGFDVVGWLTEPAGRRFLSGTVSIAIVIVGALVFWEAASAAIERYLEKASGDTTALARRARARTLLPLLRNFLFLVMAVMVVLVVLAEIGINIGPLLAGAGIVGLAIGFGSQKLVQDFITGAFILFEDAVAVGDVVRVANIAGLVEAISLRSIRLRDLSGNVHTIPFSAVDTVTNMTKIFSFYVFEVGIAYRENVDQVIEILRDLGEEMREDPDFGPKILAPLEVLGVDAFADSAVIIKARFKTRPIEQWVVGREFNRRMKNRFDELGIEIPFPHRTIYMGELKDGTAPPLNVRASGPGPLPVTPVGPVGEDTPPPSRAPSGSGQTDQGGE
jgi:small conductance mechanosensitive channel